MTEYETAALVKLAGAARAIAHMADAISDNVDRLCGRLERAAQAWQDAGEAVELAARRSAE